MSAEKPRRYYLLTAPRTASNLLLRILNIEKQPSLSRAFKYEYFFAPTMDWRLGDAKLAERHLNDWTLEERAKLTHCYQSCFDKFQNDADTAALQGKDFFVKEHAAWLVEPVAETKFLFGDDSIDESPWTIKSSTPSTHSALNNTILPDEFLRTWLPTFLIRHPALTFPSIYRTCIDNEGREAARKLPARSLEMTMHWMRTLYDWYVHQDNIFDHESSNGVNWPVVLDADDVILNPEILIKYSRRIGLDPGRLQFAWQPASQVKIEQMSDIESRMRSTISASRGILKDKASSNLSIDEEAVKWRDEFGQEEAEKIAEWVRAAMQDYEYMKAKRLRAEGS